VPVALGKSQGQELKDGKEMKEEDTGRRQPKAVRRKKQRRCRINPIDILYWIFFFVKKVSSGQTSRTI